MFKHQKKSERPSLNSSQSIESFLHKVNQNLSYLAEAHIKEVMTPRVEVVALETPITSLDIVNAVKQSGHSRFLVYHDELDNLLGVLFTKDLLRDEKWLESYAQSSKTGIEFFRYLRSPYLLPESMGVLAAFLQMQTDRRDFAVVLDEHGGVSGILTSKDILRHVFGEIPDEFDAPEPERIMKIDDNRYLVDASISIDELEAAAGIKIRDGKYVTVGGFILDSIGDIPSQGDSCSNGDYKFRVVEMDKRRVSKVLIQKLNRD